VRQALLGAYRRLPVSARHCLRPSNALEECASFLPHRARLACLELSRAVRGVLFAAQYRSQLALLEGASKLDGAPLRVAADLGQDALVYWTQLLFDGTPSRRVIRELRGAHAFARVGLPDADLTLLRLGRLARRHARARGCLVVPAWVQTSLDTRRTLDAIIEGQRSGRSSRKDDIRRARKAGFVPVLAHGPDEVRHFMDEWCNPFVRARYGAGVIRMDEHWVRQMGRVCSVMWIERDGARVGGALLEPRGREVRNLAFGVRDPAAVSEGVLSAAYWLMIEHAVREGYHALQLGSSRPVLSDGVLRHKLKWGGILVPARQWDYLAVAVGGGSAAARAFLAAHPLIAEEGGRLVAVTSGDGARTLPSSGLSDVRVV